MAVQVHAVACAYRPVTRVEVRAALSRYSETRDRNAREFILLAYQGLAYSLAARFAQRGEDVDDLNQVALLGLLKAIDRFDPAHGAELTTFATATIVGELKRHLRDRGWWVRPPRRVHDLHLSAQQAIEDLTHRNGRSPTVDEVAEQVGATAEEIVEALDAGALRNGVSLEVGVNKEEAFQRIGLGAIDQRLAEVERRLSLDVLLARLSERDRTMIRLRFLAGWSQTEIAAFVGISQMQVSRMLARSLAQLRAWSEPEMA